MKKGIAVRKKACYNKSSRQADPSLYIQKGGTMTNRKPSQAEQGLSEPDGSDFAEAGRGF